MSIALPALAVVLAAFCVWLTVRIVNRREGWAKWALATMIGMPALYVASFGPACWLGDRDMLSDELIDYVFEPLATGCINSRSNTVCAAARWYGELLPTPQLY